MSKSHKVGGYHRSRNVQMRNARECLAAIGTINAAHDEAMRRQASMYVGLARTFNRLALIVATRR